MQGLHICIVQSVSSGTAWQLASMIMKALVQ